MPVLARAQFRVRHAARRIAELGVVRIPLGDRMLLALVALARGASDDVGVGSRVARSVHDDLEVLLHTADYIDETAPARLRPRRMTCA